MKRRNAENVKNAENAENRINRIKIIKRIKRIKRTPTVLALTAALLILACTLSSCWEWLVPGPGQRTSREKTTETTETLPTETEETGTTLPTETQTPEPTAPTTDDPTDPQPGEAVNWCSHEHTEKIADKDATCVSDGYKNRKKCTDCGAELENTGRIVPAYGHEYNGRKCIYCSKNKPSIANGGQFEGSAVIWQLYDDGELAISGNGAIPDFPEDENSYFFGYDKAVTSIVVYNGVTRIGNCAFRNLKNAVTISVSSSVREIGDHAFDGWQLKTLNLSFGLKKVGKDNFTGNKLFFLELPSSLESVGAGSFSSEQLVTLRVPASVKTYEAYEDQYSNLRNVVFMGDEDSAKTLDLHRHLTRDGGCANVYLYYKFTDKASSLPYCTKRGQTQGDFTYCVFTDNRALITSYKGSAAEVVIPEKCGPYTVFGVESECFKNNKTIRSVTLPATCTDLYEKAFVDSSIETLTVLSPTLRVGPSAFSGCSSLKTLNFDGVFTDVGGGAFSSTSFKNFPISPDMKIARHSSFANSDIEEVDFSHFTYIGNSAFARTSIPSTIDLTGVKEIESGAFYSCSLTGVNVTGVERIAHSAFAGNKSLTKENVIGLEGVKTVEDGAFPFAL